ncbi:MULTISPECIES: acetylglutamate kinase [unclassified Helicobacter]|uniref:acetylglutamate kinase n=1 Tax=unclassified Helicobacter TaxID=2593540 RepID=UPI0018F823CD|nr:MULTISPECIES: acetylglutamate kinase [unclassified Helicobacter]
MQDLQNKAQTLIEALPYIQRFSGKLIVIKYGGSAMEDESLKKSVILDIALLKSIGFKPIIIHGGGKEISKWVDLTGGASHFEHGLRVTDAHTLEIAQMVLNSINKGLVGYMSSFGVHAVGISGKDGNTFIAEKKLVKGADLGFVGQIVSVNTKLILSLLESDFVPVVCPIGMDSSAQTYNINADDAAYALAQALHAEKLVFLSDIEGIYRDFDDKNSLINILTTSEAKALLNSGSIGGGMLPKLQNCIKAVENGVSRVHIIDGRIKHCLLLEFFTDKGIGTAILKD